MLFKWNYRAFNLSGFFFSANCLDAGCNTVVEQVLSMCETLGSISSIKKKERKQISRFIQMVVVVVITTSFLLLRNSLWTEHVSVWPFAC
jgi:hypothetical protein